MGPHRDIKKGSVIYFTWDTNGSLGASVNPTVAGTISVYKDDNVVQSVAGITDVRTFDGLVGLHNCKIDTANAFYEVGKDYHVVLSACTIDGQVVNATLLEFSIDHSDIDISDQGIALAGGPATIQLAATASAVNEYYTGSIVHIASGLGAGQTRLITAYVGGTTTATVYPAWATQPNNTSIYKVMPVGSSMVEGIDPTLQAAVLTLIGAEILDSDLALHLGAGVGFRNIGNILGQLAQSEFEQCTNVFAIAPVAAQGIDAFMVAKGCIQYQRVDMSYTKNWAAPDRTYYLLYHYDAQRMNDIRKPSLGIVW